MLSCTKLHLALSKSILRNAPGDFTLNAKTLLHYVHINNETSTTKYLVISGDQSRKRGEGQ